MNKKNLAPIVLFVYNRLNHTKQTVNALKRNDLSKSSSLYIYSDGYKDNNDKENVILVRNFIKTIKGFKKIIIIEREKNFGLAQNITDGVSSIINKYKKIIVIEDDIVTSPSFLNFMNELLIKYENNSSVYHISGWNYPIKIKQDEDIFFWRVMNCWGWGTWADRWKYFDRDISKVMSNFDREKIYRFDLDDSGVFWNQVLNNNSGKINTWGIFWYAAIFMKDGLCVQPKKTYVRNIGYDGSGTNHRSSHKLIEEELNQKKDIKYPEKIIESVESIELIKQYYKNRKKNIFRRIINRFFKN